MARGSVEVTYKPTDGARIPDELAEGATFLVDLRSRGIVDAVGQRLRIRRQGGCCGLDVWVFLLVFFTTGAGVGIRKFWDKIRPHGLQMGPLAGRRKLASPASLSRALDAVELELLRGETARWLLWGVSEIDPGQELATLIGLSPWNLRLARGFEMERPPARRPVPQLRRAEPDDRVAKHWPRDPVLIEALAELDWSTLLAGRPRLVAVDVADRQRRLKTWAQNVNRYALADGTRVHLELAGSSSLRRLLGQRQRPTAAAGSAA